MTPTPEYQKKILVAALSLRLCFFFYCFSFLVSSWANQFLLGIVQNDSHWGLLDMFVLLSEDIVTFDVNTQKPIFQEMETNISSKFPHHEHGDLLLELLRVKCPVSNCLKIEIANPRNCLYVSRRNERDLP